MRVLTGRCDDLLVPRPLGAVIEIAHDLRFDGRTVVTSAHPGHDLCEVMRTEPTICAVEDVHWADGATLDVLTHLSRRIVELPLLLLLTFRDDEVPADHPLHRTLAATPSSRCRRIPLARLSLDAVRRLAGPGTDFEEVHRVTGGNPFFVSEALAGGLDRTPASVRDAVLGRFGRLEPAARSTAELVSVVPGRAELWLVEACLGAAADIAGCEEQGLLVTDRDGVRFRHELARWVVEEALSGQQRREHNRAVLRALVAAHAPDARLAHHAWRSGDDEAVVRHGLAAAYRAAESRSHREAAELFARVIEHEELLAPRVRADVLDSLSTEAYSAGRRELAVSARERALTLRRELGDPRRTGDTLRWLSRVRWWTGDRAGAEAAGQEAVAVLDDGPPGRQQAMALSNLAQLAMLTQRDDEALALGRRAAEVAQAVGDVETMVHARVNIGTALARRDLEAGLAMLEDAAREGLEHGADDSACRALVNAAWECREYHRNAEAAEYAERAMVIAQRGELTLYVFYIHATRGLLALAAGDLDLALRHAADAEYHQVPTLMIRGTVALRRGEPEVDALIEEGWALATATTELQRLRPMACLRAEAAWLHGDQAGLNAATRDTYELALSRGTPWDVGELAVWRWRAGLLDAVPPDLSEQHALEIAGAPAEAAAIWSRLGEPYSQALALLGSQDADHLREAIELLDEMGAVAVLPLARARLRHLGATSVPRGRMSSTRSNPGGLTDRQLEVLQLMVAGLTNSEIARRLVLSPKTVEHHVGAVLAKLGAASRVEAADAARRLGVVGAEI